MEGIRPFPKFLLRAHSPLSERDRTLMERIRCLCARLEKTYQCSVEDLPEEMLLRILSEETLGGDVAAVSKQWKRLRDDDGVWEARADELNMPRKRLKGGLQKERVRAELDWGASLFETSQQFELPSGLDFAVERGRSTTVIEATDQGWNACSMKHETQEWHEQVGLEDFWALFGSRHYVRLVEREVEIVKIANGEVVRSLPRLEGELPGDVEVDGKQIYEMRDNRVRLWDENGKSRDLEGLPKDLQQLQRGMGCLALTYEDHSASLFVGESRFDLDWKPSQYVPEQFFIGNLFCRFSYEKGIEAFDPAQKGKRVYAKEFKHWSIISIEGMEGAVIQKRDGSFALLLEGMKLVDLQIVAGDRDTLMAACRPRPGLLLLGFDTGRLAVMRWDTKKVLEETVVEKGGISAFHVGEGARVLVECQQGAIAYDFLPHYEPQAQ